MGDFLSHTQSNDSSITNKFDQIWLMSDKVNAA